MNCKTKILVAVVITALLTYFTTREFSPEYDIVKSTTDTTITVTETITETENTFTAEQVGSIKQVLIDSLSAVYGAVINNLRKAETEKGRIGETAAEPEKQVAYVSEIDSSFVAVDDTGNVTDSINVTSTFISPDPLPENSLHLLRMKHKSFNRHTETTTTITTETLVEKRKSFLERFSISPNLSAGVGLISKQFDFYFGVGVSYGFD